jgi:hypothetical protein
MLMCEPLAQQEYSARRLSPPREANMLEQSRATAVRTATLNALRFVSFLAEAMLSWVYVE